MQEQKGELKGKHFDGEGKSEGGSDFLGANHDPPPTKVDVGQHLHC